MIEDDYVYYEETEDDFMRVYEYCTLPTIKQTSHFVLVLLLHCLAFNGLTKIFAHGKHNMHAIATILGLMYVFGFALRGSLEALFVIPLVLLSHNALHHLNARSMQPIVVIGPIFAFILIFCEFFGPDREAWLKMRSVVMIAMMKIISLACEVHKSKEVPSLLEYNGYLWCPANVVLGPWMSFKEYKARSWSQRVLGVEWIWSVIKYASMSLIFACCSNCIASFMLDDHNNVFVVAFRQALCFRMSHYFISYAASAAMVAAGFSDDAKKPWTYAIANPLEIEAPRSLASVVTNWNIPTHTFLKRYVFPAVLPHGYFAAITVTFLASSMLHGMSVEVSVVLLTLGVFSYAQTKFQDRVANLLDCCVRVKACRNCKHSRGGRSLLATACNALFTLSTMILLTYVGCLMDDVGEDRTARDILLNIYDRWTQLFGVGHLIAVFCISFAWISR